MDPIQELRQSGGTGPRATPVYGHEVAGIPPGAGYVNPPIITITDPSGAGVQFCGGWKRRLSAWEQDDSCPSPLPSSMRPTSLPATS